MAESPKFWLWNESLYENVCLIFNKGNIFSYRLQNERELKKIILKEKWPYRVRYQFLSFSTNSHKILGLEIRWYRISDENTIHSIFYSPFLLYNYLIHFGQHCMLLYFGMVTILLLAMMRILPICCPSAKIADFCRKNGEYWAIDKVNIIWFRWWEWFNLLL